MKTNTVMRNTNNMNKDVDKDVSTSDITTSYLFGTRNSITEAVAKAATIKINNNIMAKDTAARSSVNTKQKNK